MESSGSGSGQLNLYWGSTDTTQREGLGPDILNWPNRQDNDITLRTTLMNEVDKEVLELFKKMNLLLVKTYICFCGLIL